MVQYEILTSLNSSALGLDAENISLSIRLNAIRNNQAVTPNEPALKSYSGNKKPRQDDGVFIW